MKRLITLALATLLVVGVMAPAANAITVGTGTITGTANVGRHFMTAPTGGSETNCTKNATNVFARGQGLYFPPPLFPAPKDGVFSIHSTITGAFVHQGQPRTAGALHVCGWLTHVGKISQGTNIGPACGVSKGHNGRGQGFFTGGGGVNIFDLGWKSSAGGTLPITGKYQAFDGGPGSKNKLPKWGNLAAQVQAQGGGNCAQQKACPNQKTEPAGPSPIPPAAAGCGAQQFTVAGTFELIHIGTSKDSPGIVRLNDLPGTCKAGDPTCLYDPKTSSKEPIPGKTT